MPTTITIRDLVKVFASPRGEVRAVDGVSLDIKPGELFFLLGPSGCGKTTLLRMIAGFIDPTAGSIALNDRDITHTPPNKRNTGMVFQSYALWPHMTVAGNVAFGLQVRKIPKPDREARVIAALESVQLAGYAKRKPNELSGGQQQRVALARALVIRPDILLLDEPLSNLDAKLRIDLRSQIRTICKDAGITSVYVTHDQKEALSMADRIAILRDGKVVQVGTPADLYRRPGSRFVAQFLGETNFLEATVTETNAEHITLSTPAGPLVAARASAPDDLEPKAKVTCSIRPEAIRLVDPAAPCALRGSRIKTTYLGEIAQHTIRLSDSSDLLVAELNPSGVQTTDQPAQVGIAIDPTDVVVLTDS